ncbi:hypothetical protein FACS1894208_04220 [Clostridia bacterium]|nr:hypothetical protein FACS1894208_04220 [Clostridia bacterium]
MLTAEFIKQLKQSNVSHDAQKTKERIKETYKNASKEGKQLVIDLSAQTRNTIYRVERTGNVSAKLLLPIAQVGGVSPFWLAGDTDDRGTFDIETVKSFLISRKYKKLAATLTVEPVEKKEKRKYTKRVPKVEAPAAETVDAVPVPSVKPVSAPLPVIDGDDDFDDEETTTFTFDLTEQMKKTVEELSAEDAAKLLNALFLRAKAGGQAKQLCEVVKYCLLA